MKDVSRTGVRQHTANEYRARVCRAMNFISQNLDRELPLEEIARAARFSKFHFQVLLFNFVSKCLQICSLIFPKHDCKLYFSRTASAWPAEKTRRVTRSGASCTTGAILARPRSSSTPPTARWPRHSCPRPSKSREPMPSDHADRNTDNGPKPHGPNLCRTR